MSFEIALEDTVGNAYRCDGFAGVYKEPDFGTVPHKGIVHPIAQGHGDFIGTNPIAQVDSCGDEPVLDFDLHLVTLEDDGIDVIGLQPEAKGEFIRKGEVGAFGKEDGLILIET